MPLAKRSLPFIALILGTVGLLAAPARAALFVFEVPLDGLQEVPPNASPAFGFAQVTVDDVTNVVDVVGSYQDLLAGTVAAHIHGPASPGVNAPVIFGLTLTLPGSTTGTFTGNGAITAGQVTAMLNGLTYINVHTSVFPGGEIRGQLVPEPASFVLLALGGFMIAGRRNRTEVAQQSERV